MYKNGVSQRAIIIFTKYVVIHNSKTTTGEKTPQKEIKVKIKVSINWLVIVATLFLSHINLLFGERVLILSYRKISSVFEIK